MLGKSLIKPLSNYFTRIKYRLSKLRRPTLFKIVGIEELSNIPGETKFSILDIQKKTINHLNADQIIKQGYDLLGFNDFHASLIAHAQAGKIYEFLNIEDIPPANQIKTKVLDKNNMEYRFTILNKNGTCCIKSAKEISQDKALLNTLSFNDIYDVAYTQGSEAMIKEKIDLLLAKSRSQQIATLQKKVERI